MQNEIFISHSSQDAKNAQKLIEYIEKNGYDCYISSRDISGGLHYAKDIVNVIKGCKIVVLIASSHSNLSEHVLNEIDICVENQKTIIPLFIEDFEISDEFRYYLGRSQRVVVEGDDITEAFPRLMDAIRKKYPKATAPTASTSNGDLGEEGKKTKTVFEYDSNRGIMINPEDRMRNVSFRQDTFINMMGGIFSEIANTIDADHAEKVYYQCGFDGGSNFGTRLNQMLENSNMSIVEKLQKWCEFDSCVGWGRFQTNIELDEEKGTLSGTLGINECFFVDKKHNHKICSYIIGYCTGVIEALLGNIDVTLTCVTCPMKNKFKSECVFNISLTMEEND